MSLEADDDRIEEWEEPDHFEDDSSAELKFANGSAAADLRQAVDSLLACLERHEFSRSFAEEPDREELIKARAELNAAFAKHLGDPETYARRRRILDLAKDWLAEAATCAPAFQPINFQRTKALLENVSPAFADLTFEKANSLIKPSPQGRVGPRAVASRWAFAVGAFTTPGDAFSDTSQEKSDAAFKEAVREGRRPSRAKK